MKMNLMKGNISIGNDSHNRHSDPFLPSSAPFLLSCFSFALKQCILYHFKMALCLHQSALSRVNKQLLIRNQNLIAKNDQMYCNCDSLLLCRSTRDIGIVFRLNYNFSCCEGKWTKEEKWDLCRVAILDLCTAVVSQLEHCIVLRCDADAIWVSWSRIQPRPEQSSDLKQHFFDLFCNFREVTE